MDLFKEIITNVLSKEEIKIEFTNLKVNTKEIVEIQCYKALKEIRNVIINNNLSDFECIEKIVCIFENLGSDGDSRNDF